jgi:hypothetical protein
MTSLIAKLKSLLRADAMRLDGLRLALGRAEARAVRNATFAGIRAAESQVFSQWGEDGIIQHLLGKVPIENPSFVEFGVQDYSESNTRFLLCNDNWSGIIIDSGRRHQRFITDRGLDWRYDLQAISAFITRENIDSIITSAGLRGDIGLLSVDIDGNDYWVLDAIRSVSPRILIVEYNSHFGAEHAITIPYQADFERRRAHWSCLYYGASLPALVHLAERKGFVFLGCNSAGNNAFFVRRDVAAGLRGVDAREGYVSSKYRESRDRRGRLSLIGPHEARRSLIAELPVVEVMTGRAVRIGDLFSDVTARQLR